MKQHITLKQLNELSEKGKYWAYSKKKGWRKPDCDYDLWSIGQMIEFLWDNNSLSQGYSEGKERIDWKARKMLTGTLWQNSICDSLWNACKEVLCVKK